MADNNSFISDISYTNKDFQSVYTELLDLTKKLTDKWDPRMSNESDPGVVLLKLNAMVADKNNYNIDKNILETFPASVTQEKNARNLFEQLGYSMKWYRSATTGVSISWIGETGSDDSHYKIPRFTMLCNDEGTVIYTLTEDCYITPAGTLYSEYVSDKSIATTVPAIEGVINEYAIDGNTLITLLNLDENNRLYFDINNVSENGIFINNVKDDGTDLDNYLDWEKVDNLSVQKLGSKLYKFGVDNKNQCYLEFPADIDSLIGSGLRIHYLSSSGESGNIKANTLTKFYADVKDSTYNITLSSENTLITNGSSAQNGHDPETIEEAYKNFKKVVGTFKTLVTIRDYQNAINSSELVSNCFITDRTNDVQNSYKIVTQGSDIQGKKLIVEKDALGNPKMDAFTLKMYLLNWVDNVYDKTSYNKTFSMVESLQPSVDVEEYIESTKSIQHDFGNLEPMKPLMYKNKYPVTVKIIPQYTVSEQQQREIENNVRLAIYNNFNAKAVEFGEEITYDELYDVISNADSRIKAIVLDELVFSTYAVVYDPTEPSEADRFKEVLISGVDSSYPDLSNDIRLDIYTKSVLNGNTQLLTPVTDFTYGLNQQYVNLISGETGNVPVLDNIESITTETEIPIEFDEHSEAEYQIRDNEKIMFYAPNLVDEMQFGNYIKYEYSYDGQANDYFIPSNTDYRLNAGEKIVLYYKTTDDDEALYNYTALTSGTIVKTSFNLYKTSPSISEMIGKDLTGSGTTTHALSSKVSNLETDLGANRTISTRKFNIITLDSSVNKCYWILNTKKSDIYGDYYELFTPTIREYILKSGEYFIYTNETQTALEILGQGTKLTLSGSYDKPWKVYAIDNSLRNIVSDGIDAFNDSDWFTFKGNVSQVTAMEMQFLTLMEGDSIKITSLGGPDFTISNTPAGVDFNDYVVEYTAPSSSSSGTLPKMSLSDSSWDVVSNLGIRLSNDIPQVLQSGQTMILYQKSENGEIIPPVIISGDDADKYVLANAIIYSDGGNSVTTEFTDLEGNKTYLSTYAYTDAEISGSKIVLNDSGCSISFMNDIPTKITEGMKWCLSGFPSGIPTGGTETTLTTDIAKLIVFWKDSQYYYWDTYRTGSTIINNMTVAIENESTPSIGDISETGKTKNGSALYTAIENLTTTVASGEYFTCTKSGFDNSVDFRLPEGKYIFAFDNSSKNMINLSLSLSTWEEAATNLYPINDLYSLTKKTEFKDSTVEYLYVDIGPAPESDYSKLHTLTFNMLKNPSLTYEKISIPTIYRYSDSEVGFSDVLKHIVGYGEDEGLDPTGYYDYTYEVNDSVRIDNPLNPNSFNDINHICNPHTICQIGAIDVKVINRLKNG